MEVQILILASPLLHCVTSNLAKATGLANLHFWFYSVSLSEPCLAVEERSGCPWGHLLGQEMMRGTLVTAVTNRDLTKSQIPLGAFPQPSLGSSSHAAFGNVHLGKPSFQFAFNITQLLPRIIVFSSPIN